MAHDPEPAADAMTPELLAGLLDRHAAALELYARQLCRDADDAVQEAFIELARQTCLPQDAAAWLYRVVRNKALSRQRAAGRRQRHEEAAADCRGDWFQPPATEGLDGATAAAALESLPTEQREVIVAHLWGGLSFTEIGRLMGSSDSTAHRRYVAALAALRERLVTPCTKNP